MFNIGDYVVYKREVCKICDYKKKFIGDKDYYSLIPVMDKSLKIEVPVNSDFIRNVIDKNTANKIIDICGKYSGQTKVCFYLEDKKKYIAPKNKISVDISNSFYKEISDLISDKKIGLM